MLGRMIATGIVAAALAISTDAGAQQTGGQTGAQPGAAQQTRKSPRQRQIICRGAPIPAGWILVDNLRDTSMCGGSNPDYVNAYNVWAIEKFAGAPPGSVIAVCAASPIPEGWSLVDVYRDKSVCGHPDDLFAINVKSMRKNR